MTIKEKAEKEIFSIRKTLINIGLNCSDIEERQYNYEFTVTSGNEKLKIQVYFGKKGVKTILQGNKESLLYKEVNIAVSEQQIMNFAEDSIEPEKYVGSDESGKGDVFGPLVVTAFYTDKKTEPLLLQMGVTDSKSLSEKQITEIAKKIRINFPEQIETVILNPAKYNELYSKFNNLNNLLTWAHSTAVSALLKRFECNEVIVDKFSNQQIKISQVLSNKKINVLQTTKGERFLGVAAASIIARDTFNKWFQKTEQQYFSLPKGASTEVEKTIVAFINKFSKNELHQVAKLHFKTVKKFY